MKFEYLGFTAYKVKTFSGRKFWAIYDNSGELRTEMNTKADAKWWMKQFA